MSEPRGVLHWFIPKPGTLDLGLHPLHVEMTSFNWFIKAAKYQDFRNWRISGIRHLFFFIFVRSVIKYSRYWRSGACKKMVEKSECKIEWLRKVNDKNKNS